MNFILYIQTFWNTKENMKIQTITYYFLIILIILLIQIKTQWCQPQRCCGIAPTCTANYCIQHNDDTWNSTQPFSYTKLVLANNKCLPCAYDCKSCSSQTTCDACALDFYPNLNSCSLCSDRCQICQVVNSISRCQQCQAGAFLDTSSSTCKSCPTGAKVCSATSISSCKTGYRLTSNSLYCTQCPSNCDDCRFSDITCFICSKGYYLNTSQLCKSCNSSGLTNCLNCYYDYGSGSTKCNLCASRYYLSSTFTCLACPSNCITCNSTNKACTFCDPGYYVLGGGCSLATSLVTNCQSYSAPSTCSVCISGYYLSNNICLPCSILCTKCHGRHFGACTACDPTIATLFNLMCLPTDFPSQTTFQNFFSIPHAVNRLSGGSLACLDTLYIGTTISVTLSNLAAYQVNLKWKLYSVGSTRNYQITFNSDSNQIGSFSTSSFQYNLCSQSYYLSINNYNFTGVKLTNTLTFTGIGGQIAIQQILVTAKRCSSLCLQCSQTKCTSCLTTNLYTQDAYCVYLCSSGYYTYQAQKTCVKQCPLASYGRTTDSTCQPCVSPCYSCLNDNVCLTCIANYYLSNDGTCVQACPYRYYARNTTQTCQKCIGRCLQCVSDTECISCRVGFLQSSDQTCVDQCLTPGYYSDIPTLSCKQCDTTCLTCSLQAIRCLTCPTERVFYDNLCVTVCPDKYFNNSGVCTLCSYPCQNCITTSTTCTSCVDRYLKSNQCLISCGNGYYQQNVQLLCLQCNSNCTKCIYKDNYCLSCSSGFYLSGIQCLSTCPDGFYGDSSTKLCLACTSLCQTCSNSTFCLSCSSNFLLTASGTCVSSSFCPNATYADITTLKCLPCQSPCKTCQFLSTYCTSCLSNSSTPLLENNSCVGSCSSQLYYAASNNTCVACQSPCVTCLNQTACLSCISGYKYSNNVCSSTCSVGTFYDTLISDCTPCSSNCLTCNSATFCQLCATNYYIESTSMTDAKCVSLCSNGYYNDPLSLSCQQCLFPCQNCESSIDCLSCQQGVLYNKRCIAICPDSTYQSGTTCLDCGGNCLTCVNSSTICKVCKTGFFLKGTDCLAICPVGYYAQNQTQMCLPCPSTCSQCTNNTFCTACISGRTYLNQVTNLCVYYCPSGKFGDLTTQKCQNCQPQCLTCNSTASNCLTCSANYLLVRINSVQFQCKTTCPNFYYQQGFVCYPCLFPCLNCTSSIACTSCVVGTVLHSVTSSCLHSCPIGTYSFNGQCLSCQSPCATCSNSTYCLSCLNNLYVHNGGCVSTCPVLYYPQASKICNQCYGFCKTCNSKFYCLTCHAGYAFDGYCYSSCPIGSYADTKNGICIACQYPCLQCSISSTYCTRCTAGLFVYRGNCSSTCPSSTYIDTDNQQCVSCTRPCQTCQNQFTCKSCLGGYLLYLNKSCIINVDKCPNDYYKKDSTQCVPITWCPSNYLIDQTLRTCSQACSVGKYTDLVNKKCLTACPEGYYAGKDLICENYQSNKPPSLLGSQAIAFIRSSRMHLVVQYNQSVTWSQNSDNLYSLAAQQSRLLQSTFTNSLISTGTILSYSTVNTDELQIKLQALPYKTNIYLPAYYVSSTDTKLPLQTPTVSVKLPEFFVYTHQQIYTGSLMGQFSQGITWLILLISLVFLFINRLSDLYILWDTAQLLYVLIFLNIQYPPPLNQFFLGMAGTHLNFIPSLFTVSSSRNVSSLPFYAYSHDNYFLRTAGHSVLLLLVFFIIYILLKISQALMKRVQKIRQFVNQKPFIKKFVYRGLLRFRWHHTSDIFFTTYLNVMLFGIAEIYYISQNPNNYFSNGLSGLMIIVYFIFPIFVAYKLYKHFGNISRGKLVNNLKCFYRGIEKNNKFGVSIILIRYIRKFTYAIIIAIFSMTPLYALPILMFTSILFAIFIFANKPYKKRLSNIITIITQVSLVIVFAVIAVTQFLPSTVSSDVKQGLAWVCCLFLVFSLFALIYELFCKTLFYLEPQYNDDKKKEGVYDPLKDEQYIRQKAGQFFDMLFPQLKKGFNLDDSQDQFFAYEQGDSQNSENNDLRQRAWGLQQQDSQNFKHYAQSDSQSKTDMQQRKKIPNLLIRVAKQI